MTTKEKKCICHILDIQLENCRKEKAKITYTGTRSIIHGGNEQQNAFYRGHVNVTDALLIGTGFCLVCDWNGHRIIKE